jgi:hypothetical protein
VNFVSPQAEWSEAQLGLGAVTPKAKASKSRQFSRICWEHSFVPRISEKKEIKVPYRAYQPSVRPPDAVIIKLYTSGDQIRGYVRKTADPAKNDTIFPGEEMEPEAAFKLAASHSEAEAPIFVELTEGVQWDPTWGELLP